MRRPYFVVLFVAILALATALVVISSRPALAVGSQSRTFVATTGSDANPCTRIAPCRTFAAALLQTASGGEVVALDTGGYGTVAITQSVTISAAPGVQASISPTSGNAIAVNVGPSDIVALRNLTLNSLGAENGIVYGAGGQLSIENLTITGFGSYGVFMSVGGDADLSITDTAIRGIGNSGIYVASSGGSASATIVRTRLEKNLYGLTADSGARTNVKDTVASANAVAFSALQGIIELEGCVVSGNGTGITATGGTVAATVHVSNTTITYSLFAITVGSNGSVLSRGNNTLVDNTFNGPFSGTYSAQ